MVIVLFLSTFLLQVQLDGSRTFHEFNATYGPETCPFNRYPDQVELIKPVGEPDFWRPELPPPKPSLSFLTWYYTLIGGGVVMFFIAALILLFKKTLKLLIEKDEERSRQSKSNTFTRNGFSLVELIVCIGIISILIGLLLPAIQSAREAARRTQCQNNIRQIGISMLSYESARKAFPPANFVGENGDPQRTWITELLPYLGLQNLYDHYDRNNSYHHPNNRDILLVSIPIMKCPSDSVMDTYFVTDGVKAISGSYHPCKGVHPMLSEWLYENNFLTSKKHEVVMQENETGEYRPRRLSEITDGLSNTLIFSEIGGLPYRTHFNHLHPQVLVQGGSPFDTKSPWILHGVTHHGTSPGPIWNITNGAGGHDDFDGEPFSFHGGVVYFSRADGSVVGLTDDMNISILIKQFGINDGEVINIE